MVADEREPLSPRKEIKVYQPKKKQQSEDSLPTE